LNRIEVEEKEVVKKNEGEIERKETKREVGSSFWNLFPLVFKTL